MRTTIQTPDGPRTVPDWAKCHCVTRHSPNYIHPYPFALPSGDELWLCPNTYHQAKTLLGIYRKLDGPPTGVAHARFNYFVRSLIKFYWQQVMQDQASLESYADWKASQQDKDDWSNWGLFEVIKKVEAGG